MKQFEKMFFEAFNGKQGLEYIESNLDFEYISKEMEFNFDATTRVEARNSIDKIVSNIINKVNNEINGNFVCNRFSVALDLLLNQLKQANLVSPNSNAYYLLRFIVNFMKINKLEFYDFNQIKENFFTTEGPFFNKELPFRNLDVACIMYFLDKIYFDTYIKQKVFFYCIYDHKNYNIDNLILENKLLALVLSEQYED